MLRPSLRALRLLSTTLALFVLPALHGCDGGTAPGDGATGNDAALTDGARADAPDLPRDAAPADVQSSRDVQVAPDVQSPTDPYDAARDACVAEINRYRAMLGLTPYLRWREAEACADQMAAHDAMVGVAHDGFQNGICSPRGGGQNECPRYGGPSALNGCLAQMWAEGPTADGSWDVAHGHYMNMVGDYTYMGFHQHFTRVACGYSAAGWMLQNFQ